MPPSQKEYLFGEDGVTEKDVVEEGDGLLGLAVDEEGDGDRPLPVGYLSSLPLQPNKFTCSRT